MITVLPERNESGDPIFRAIMGDRFAIGKSVGSAVDALAETVSNESSDEALSSNLIWVQRFKADRFFAESQRDRLSDLMAKFRVARDAGEHLSPTEQSELESLVEAETLAMIDRTKALLEIQK